ncbi:lactonase family protein [Pseudomonas sp. CCI3.2]|uniref:lactonase family protein n=1 Tax=unclassified Pseudomonas TaxID=196821 RepID=UPI002AC99BB2|nr:MULTISPECIES: lactonase family protein [unclassified Pseudomonas]MEB0077560.1 lactonase family protein [Pseudomonas sp. MH10out]MEB0090318.1 lactonase family protein [Pseudomonas sp. CCI4.2]MEB0103100.1 lactonase family protein [Pseudomonas sp. CCI3.2]MEB0132623.1 lactonase family protein [Pseudomonas sp. CCI2.4]MEB0159025.1 lactonase family protein [Pseudomonas sp. AH2 (2023)]
MNRKILPWLVIASGLTAFPVLAQNMTDYDLLVGAYTQGKSEGIYRYRFDSKTGQIDAQPRQVIKSENPSWLTLSKDQRLLFAVNENGPGQTDTVGKVSSFAINGKTHEVTPINQVDSRGDEPTHSSLSADGRFLFVANYAVHPDPGGALAVVPVDKSGKLSPVSQTETHPASKVDPERQASSHVHSAVPSPDGNYLIASDLGADKLFVFHYTGKGPQPLQPAKTPSVDLPPGSGPRHLLFSNNGKHAYLTLEMAAQVALFDYHDGVFKRTQLVDLSDKSIKQKVGGGGLHSSADGKFLYVANRGDVNQLVVFAIDSASGKLKEIQRRSVEGTEPREFSIDPTGHFMLIANQKSNQIVTVHLDPKTGMLGDTVQKMDFDSPSDFRFLTR